MTARPSAVQLEFGAEGEGRLSLRPLGRNDPEATDFWEANWLKVEVEARAGAFAGRFEADLRTDELERFAVQLAALETPLAGAPGPAGPPGTAALESAEGWVTVKLAPGRDGGLAGTGEVRDDPTAGRSLRFRLEVDAAQLRALREALLAVLTAYPVVGDPGSEPSGLLLGDEPEEPGEA